MFRVCSRYSGRTVLVIVLTALLSTFLYEVKCEESATGAESNENTSAESGAGPQPAIVNDGFGPQPFESVPATAKDPLLLYQRMFQQKRYTQREAVKTMVNFKNYEKQYKTISMLMEKVHKVMTDSRVFLMEVGFIPGDPFPTNETVRDAYSLVVENTAFFADMILHFPNIIEDLLNRNREWDLIVKWGIGFCTDSKVFYGADEKLMHLASQEMGLVEKDPDYINPYKVDVEQELKKAFKDSSGTSKDDKKKKEKKRKKGEKKRGPRLSAPSHNEL